MIVTGFVVSVRTSVLRSLGQRVDDRECRVEAEDVRQNDRRTVQVDHRRPVHVRRLPESSETRAIVVSERSTQSWRPVPAGSFHPRSSASLGQRGAASRRARRPCETRRSRPEPRRSDPPGRRRSKQPARRPTARVLSEATGGAGSVGGQGSRSQGSSRREPALGVVDRVGHRSWVCRCRGVRPPSAV